MSVISQVQLEVGKWKQENFPEEIPAQTLMGVVEEVGELCHLQLCGEQGRREGKDPKSLPTLKMDAVGDIVVFLAQYCNSQSLDLEHCVEVTWNKVKHRTRANYPEGGTE